MPTVLITGCSSGIGRALADAFRDAGHEVWATARKPTMSTPCSPPASPHGNWM
jgi:NADP-dependent 3-hydroxy acid dehydrogenase YdfG